ncbi:MAG: hypothetical protein CBC42_06095 [Betaproteobacteria bacterium TMED82]|nr:MAG: hypothetical protein CBC42_06095 [Betaproteobacteria bacterium TMED82]|tara:strand:+ start:64897 stop:65718 length:822 start_codon:yes stop_codon:yes gene_type:complete
MATLLLFILLFFSAALLVMVIYTIDRLNSVEKITSVLNSVVAPSPSVSGIEAQAMFDGLTGMTLWEAMSGKPVEGWDEEVLETMKPRYKIVLQKHTEAIFDEGLLDGHQETYKHLPSNTMIVSMLRGAVESWIPQNYASGVYQIGLEWSRNDISEAKRLRERLDLLVDEMFSDCDIELKSPLSRTLLPESEEERLRADSEETAEDGDETALQLGSNETSITDSDELVSEETQSGAPVDEDAEGAEEKGPSEKTPENVGVQPKVSPQVPAPTQA